MFPGLKKVRSLSNFEKRVGVSLDKLKQNMEDMEKKYHKLRAKSEPHLLAIPSTKNIKPKIPNLTISKSPSSPKKDQKPSMSTKIQQLQKLRACLKKPDPQKRLKINRNQKLDSIKLQQNEYVHLDLSVLTGSTNQKATMVNDRVILQGGKFTELFTNKQFERIVEICGKLKEIPFFKYMLQQKAFFNWKAKTKKLRNKKSKEETLEKINVGFFKGLLMIQEVGSKHLGRRIFNIPKEAIHSEDFDLFFIERNIEIFQSFCSSLLTEISGAIFRFFYEKNLEIAYLTREEKMALLLYSCGQIKKGEFSEFEYLRNIYTSYEYARVLKEFQIFMKLSLYQTSEIFLSMVEKNLNEMKEYLRIQLKKTCSIDYQKLFRHLSDGNIEAVVEFNKKNLPINYGIILNPKIHEKKNTIQITLIPQKFQFIKSVSNYFSMLVKNAKIASLNLESKAEEMFVKQILSTIDEYTIDKFINEKNQIQTVKKQIINLIDQNEKDVRKVFLNSVQFIHQAYANIKIQNHSIQEAKKFINNFSLNAKTPQSQQIEEKKAKDMEKIKNTIINCIKNIRQDLLVLEKFPEKVKLGIFLIVCGGMKQVLIKYAKALEHLCHEILLSIFDTVKENLSNRLSYHEDHISLYYCEINQFVISTQTHIEFDELCSSYLEYIDIMNLLLAVWMNQKEDMMSNSLKKQTDFKLIKMQMERVKQKIEVFENKKLSKLKDLKKTKLKLKEEINRKMIILQSQINETINSQTHALNQKYEKLGIFGAHLQELKYQISNFLYVENIQIDYCIENTSTKFSIFSKLENDVSLLKQIIEKFLSATNTIQEMSYQSMEMCDISMITELIEHAVSETKVSQLRLLPYTLFIEGIKEKYDEKYAQLKIIQELQMFTNQQLEKIGQGKVFNFQNKQSYKVQEVLGFNLTDYQDEIKGIMAKKFYERKIQKISEEFENSVKPMKLKQTYKIKSEKLMTKSNLLSLNKKRRATQLNVITKDFLEVTDKKEIVDILEDMSIEISKILEALTKFQTNAYSNQYTNFLFIEKTNALQKDIKAILLIFDLLTNIENQFTEIIDYYLLISSSQIPLMPELKKQIFIIRNYWNVEIIEHLVKQEIRVILKEKDRIMSKLDTFGLMLEKIKDQFDSRLESSLKETPIFYLFSKMRIIKFLSDPFEFFFHANDFIVDIEVDSSEKSLVIETCYKETLKIKLYNAKKYTVNEINNKIQKKISESLKKSITKEKSYNQDSEEDYLLQVQFVTEMIELYKSLKKMDKGQRLKFLEERIQSVSGNLFRGMKMNQAEIMISACIEIRESIQQQNQDSSFLQSFYYSVSPGPELSEFELLPKEKPKLKRDSMMKKHRTYLVLSQKKSERIKSIDNNVDTKSKRIRSSHKQKKKNQEKSKKKSSCLNVGSGRRSDIKSETKIKEFKEIGFIKNTKQLVLNKKEENQFKVYYNFLHRKIELSSNLIDFRSLNFSFGSEKTMFEYFNAFFHPGQIRITANFESVQEFSARLFRKCYLLREIQNPNSFIKNIHRLQNISIVMEEIIDFYETIGKNLQEIYSGFKDSSTSQNEKLMPAFHESQVTKEKKLPHMFILSSAKEEEPFVFYPPSKISDHISQNFRTLSFEFPPIDIKLQVYSLTLQQRYNEELIMELISYMKCYQFFLRNSTHKKTSINELQQIFLWLIQSIWHSVNKLSSQTLNQIHETLSWPFMLLGDSLGQKQVIIENYYREIKRIFSLSDNPQVNKYDLDSLLLETQKQKKIAIFVGKECAGKTRLTSSAFKNSTNITINIELEHALSSVLSCETSLINYVQKLVNFQLLSDFHPDKKTTIKVFFEGFLKNDQSNLHEFLINDINDANQESMISEFCFHERNLHSITPKSLPYVTIIHIKEEDNILQEIVENLANEFTVLYEQKKRRAKIKYSFSEIGPLVKRVFMMISQKEWIHQNHLIFVRNIAKMISVMIKETKISYSNKNQSIAEETQQFIISYATYFTIRYSLTSKGLKELLAIKDDIPQFRNLENIENFQSCQSLFQKYGINWEEQEKCINNSGVYIRTDQSNILLKMMLLYMREYGFVLFYGKPNSGKTMFQEQLLKNLGMSKAKRIFVRSRNVRGLINDFQQVLLGKGRSQNNINFQSSLSIGQENDQFFIIQDNSLEIESSEKQESALFFKYLKFIIENQRIFHNKDFIELENFRTIIERRRQNPKNLINWEAFPICFNNDNMIFSRVFEAIIQKIETVNNGSSSLELYNENNVEQVVINKKVNNYFHAAETVNTVIQRVNFIGSHNWVLLFNDKILQKSLKIFINLMNSDLLSCSKKDLKIGSNFFSIKTNSQTNKTYPQNHLINEFLGVVYFMLISPLKKPLDPKYNLKDQQVKMEQFLNQTVNAMKSQKFMKNKTNTKEEVLGKQITSNMNKLLFAVKNFQVILINRFQTRNNFASLALTFQFLGIHIQKIEGIGKDVFNQIRKKQKIQGKTYYYIGLDTLLCNPSLLAYIQSDLDRIAELQGKKTEKHSNKSNKSNKNKMSMKSIMSNPSSSSITSISNLNQLQKTNNQLKLQNHFKQKLCRFYIIEYPGEDEYPDLYHNFLECKYLVDHSVVLWLHEICPETLTQEPKKEKNLENRSEKYLSLFNKENQQLFRSLKQSYCKKPLQTLQMHFKLLEKLFDNLKLDNKHYLPPELLSYLFCHSNFKAYVEFFFKAYNDAKQKITGQMKTAQIVINSIENILSDYQNIKQELNAEWQMEKELKISIIQKQRLIENLQGKIKQYHEMRIEEEINKLIERKNANKEEENNVRSKLEKYYSNSMKYLELITRQELAEIKYFYNNKFSHYKMLFEILYVCILKENNPNPDKEGLRKVIMDINLIAKIKEVDLINISDPVSINIIKEKLEQWDTDGDCFTKNIYFWVKYSIQYSLLKRQEESILQKMGKENQELNQKIIELRKKFCVQETKEKIDMLQTQKEESIAAHKKVEKKVALINSKLLKIQPIIEIFMEFKEQSNHEISKLQEYIKSLEYCILFIATQFYFTVSMPELYRSKFRKSMKKQILKILKVQKVKEQTIDILLTCYVLAPDKNFFTFNNRAALTVSKKTALSAVKYKLIHEQLVIFDPDNIFLSDLAVESYSQLKYEELLSPIAEATIAKSQLIVVHIPDDQWMIEYQRDKIKNNFEKNKKIKMPKFNLSIRDNQQCIFIKKKLNGFSEKCHNFSLISYDFNSLREDQEYAEKILKYIFCIEQTDRSFKKTTLNNYQSIQKVDEIERETKTMFHELNREICQEILSFAINQPNYLHKVSLKIKQCLQKNKQLKNLKQIYSFSDYQGMEIPYADISRTIGAAFHIFKKIIQTHQTASYFEEHNFTEKRTHHRILFTAVKLGCEYSLTNLKICKKFQHNFIYFVINFLLSGVQSIEGFLIQLKLALMNQTFCKKESKTKQIQTTKNLVKTMKGLTVCQEKSLRSIRFKNEIDSFELGFSLNLEKVIATIFKKIDKKVNISDQQILELIESTYQLSEIEEITLKKWLKLPMAERRAETAFLSQIKEDRINKYKIQNKEEMRTIIMEALFKCNIQNYVKSEKGIQHEQIMMKKNVICLICQNITKYWKNFIFSSLTKTVKFIKYTDKIIRFFIVKLSHYNLWKQMKEAIEINIQKFGNVILVIFQDSMTEKSDKFFKMLINRYNSIIITTYLVKQIKDCNTKFYELSLSQFLAIFLPIQKIGQKVNFLTDLQDIERWQRELQLIALSKGNLAGYFYLQRYHRVVRQYIAYIESITASNTTKQIIFNQGIKNVISNQFSIELFDSSPEFKNYRQSMTLGIQVPQSVNTLKKLWDCVQRRNNDHHKEEQVVFLSWPIKYIRRYLQESLYIFKMFIETLQKCENNCVDISESCLSNIQHSKLYIKKRIKAGLLEKLKSQIRLFIECIESYSSSNNAISIDKFVSFMKSSYVLDNKLMVQNLICLMQAFHEQSANQSGFFTNNINQSFCSYLLDVGHEQKMKLAPLDSHENTKNSMKIYFKLDNGTLKLVQEHSDGISLGTERKSQKKWEQKFYGYSLMLTQYEFYFDVELTFEALKQAIHK